MLNVERFEKMLSAGLIARNVWRDRALDGREMLCALAALSPEVAAAETPSPEACPASDCPPWLAELIPWLDDAPSEEAWPGIMKRLGAVARALPGADPEALRRADFACLAVAVREARSHAGAEHARVLAAIDGVLALLDEAAKGQMIDDAAWAAARAAGAAAARAAGAAEAEAEAAWAAARAAGAAAGSAEAAAARAAWAAGAAARAAARAAGAAAARAAGAAAARAASDRMADAMLTILERAVVSPPPDTSWSNLTHDAPAPGEVGSTRDRPDRDA